MIERTRWMQVLCLGTLLLIAATAARAEAPASRVDTRADQVLRDMSAYLASATEFTFTADVRFDRVLKTGQKIEFGRRARIAVRRPDRLHVDVDGDIHNERLWYDGKRFTLLDRDIYRYGSTDVPATIDAALDFLAKRFDVTSPVADVVYSDPYAILVERVRTGVYVGLHSVGGVRCHHLAFTQDNIDWQLWVEDSGRPVPCKFAITYKNVASLPQFTAVITDWDFAPRLSESLFRFTAPPDAQEMDFAELIEADRSR